MEGYFMNSLPHFAMHRKPGTPHFLNIPTTPLVSDKEILKIYLDEDQTFRKIDSKVILEISAALFLETQLMSFAGHLQKIKSKIVQMLLQEKDGWAQFFTLPKLRSLSLQAKTHMYSVMQNIWEKLKRKKKEKDSGINYKSYLCQSNNLQEIQSFHCNMINYIKDGFFYEGFNENMLYEPVRNYEMLQHSQIDHYYPPSNPKVPNQLIINEKKKNEQVIMGPQFSKQQAEQRQEEVRNFDNDVFHSSKCQKISKGSHEKRIKVQNKQDEYSSVELYSPGNQKKRIKHKQKIKPKTDKEREIDKSKKMRLKFVENLVNRKAQFLDQVQLNQTENIYASCACNGELSKSVKFFKCSVCDKCYHFKCLGIPSTAAHKTEKKTCPSCYFYKLNVFYESVGTPLAMFWTDDRELHKQKINIRGKKCIDILRNKYAIQIKLMKIDGSSLFQYEKLENMEDTLPKKPLINEIMIKSDLVSKTTRQSIRISFDLMKPQYRAPTEVPANPIILFGAIFSARQRTVQQMLQLEFEDTPTGYLDKFLETEEQIKIQVFDCQMKLIKIPARGIDCDHVGIFDLEEFLTNYQQMENNCYICSKPCRNFLIDRQIETELNKIRQKIDRPESYPSEIYYSKQGFRWQQILKLEEDDRLDEERVEDISIGSGEMDEQI